MDKKLNWFDEEIKGIDERKKEAMDEQGYKPCLSLEVGENPLVINMKEAPKEKETQYGLRKIYDLINPVDKCLMVHPITSDKMLSFMKANKLQETGRIIIIKSGSEKKTRYDFKKPKE